MIPRTAPPTVLPVAPFRQGTGHLPFTTKSQGAVKKAYREKTLGLQSEAQRAFLLGTADAEKIMAEKGKANTPRDFVENSEVVFLPSSCCVLHDLLFHMVLMQVKTAGYEA